MAKTVWVDQAKVERLARVKDELKRTELRVVSNEDVDYEFASKIPQGRLAIVSCLPHLNGLSRFITSIRIMDPTDEEIAVVTAYQLSRIGNT